MNLRLIREPSSAGATLSVLFVDGRFECFCLEDEVRERPGVPVSTWKVRGRTAIPAGRYRVIVNHSARFDRRLPLLVDVPGFDGVRIHSGNTIADTEGCILPGRLRAADRVGDSRVAFSRLFGKLEAAIARGEGVWFAIENPEPAAAAV